LQDSASVLVRKPKPALLTNILTFRSSVKVRMISQFSSDLTQGLHNYPLIPECTHHPINQSKLKGLNIEGADHNSCPQGLADGCHG